MKNYLQNIVFSKTTFSTIMILLISLLPFVFILSCSIRHSARQFLTKKYSKPCSYIDSLLNPMEKEAWLKDSLGNLGVRKNVYLSKPYLFKNHSFKGISRSCVKKELGNPAKDQDYEIEKGVGKLTYPVYINSIKEGERDSSINLELLYNKKNDLIFQFRFAVSEDPLYTRNNPFEADRLCLEIVDSLIKEHTIQEIRINENSISDKRNNFSYPTIVFMDKMKNQLSQPCLENVFGMADQYYYIYYSDSKFITAKYYLDSVSLPLTIIYNMDNLTCVSISQPIN